MVVEMENIHSASTIFWDFDGVIKESVEVKSDAFEKLFSPFGDEVSKKVRLHHEMNGGMSRYEKIPIYLKWAKLPPTSELVDQFSKKFSTLVVQKVIDSDWVPGVYSFIKNNYKNTIFFLITATPQEEIAVIINEIGLSECFHKVVGAPIKKSDAVRSIVDEFSIDTEKSIMIGDAMTDYRAAVDNQLSFILRRTPLNIGIQKDLKCIKIDNFSYE
jgi:phosphoglycolate phosphatase-like HAD superfamily hydrolase